MKIIEGSDDMYLLNHRNKYTSASLGMTCSWDSFYLGGFTQLTLEIVQFLRQGLYYIVSDEKILKRMVSVLVDMTTNPEMEILKWKSRNGHNKSKILNNPKGVEVNGGHT